MYSHRRIAEESLVFSMEAKEVLQQLEEISPIHPHLFIFCMLGLISDFILSVKSFLHHASHDVIGLLVVGNGVTPLVFNCGPQAYTCSGNLARIAACRHMLIAFSLPGQAEGGRVHKIPSWARRLPPSNHSCQSTSRITVSWLLSRERETIDENFR